MFEYSTFSLVNIYAMNAILETERGRYNWMQLILETEYLH